MKSVEELLQEALSHVPDTLDKREGSIIYDALSPACYALYGVYLDLELFRQQVMIESTYGEYLDVKVKEQGLNRIQATKAIKKGIFIYQGKGAEVAIGTRFASVDNESILYTIQEKNDDSSYSLECETAGTIGNQYMGKLIPISNGVRIDSAELGNLIVAARDSESDDELRQRFYDAVSKSPFGGNMTQYIETISVMKGVGSVQIYPTWNGGGTVKCSILSGDYRKASDELITLIQMEIDPQGFPGQGLGLAPIGHKVTIATATEKIISIECQVTTSSGILLTSISEQIKEAIEDYFTKIRKQWGNGDGHNVYKLSIYLSQVIASILGVGGVANVTNVLMNGSSADINLEESSNVQEIPILGEVMIHED